MDEGHSLQVSSMARFGVTEFVHRKVQRKGKNTLRMERKASLVFSCCIHW